MDRYEISVRVISVTGTCAYEHKVGDEWVIKSTTPAGKREFFLIFKRNSKSP